MCVCSSLPEPLRRIPIMTKICCPMWVTASPDVHWPCLLPHHQLLSLSCYLRTCFFPFASRAEVWNFLLEYVAFIRRRYLYALHCGCDYTQCGLHMGHASSPWLWLHTVWSPHGACLFTVVVTTHSVVSTWSMPLHCGCDYTQCVLHMEHVSSLWLWLHTVWSPHGACIFTVVVTTHSVISTWSMPLHCGCDYRQCGLHMEHASSLWLWLHTVWSPHGACLITVVVTTDSVVSTWSMPPHCGCDYTHCGLHIEHSSLWLWLHSAVSTWSMPLHCGCDYTQCGLHMEHASSLWLWLHTVWPSLEACLPVDPICLICSRVRPAWLTSVSSRCRVQVVVGTFNISAQRDIPVSTVHLSIKRHADDYCIPVLVTDREVEHVSGHVDSSWIQFLRWTNSSVHIYVQNDDSFFCRYQSESPWKHTDDLQSSSLSFSRSVNGQPH